MSIQPTSWSFDKIVAGATGSGLLEGMPPRETADWMIHMHSQGASGLDAGALALAVAERAAGLPPEQAGALRSAIEDRLSPGDLGRFTETFTTATAEPVQVAGLGAAGFAAAAPAAGASVSWGQLGVDAASVGRLFPLPAAAAARGALSRATLGGALITMLGSFAPAPMTRDLGGGLSVTVYGKGTHGPNGESAVFRDTSGGRTRVLDVPVSATDKGLTFDPKALQAELGRPLPGSLRDALPEGLRGPTVETFPAARDRGPVITGTPDPSGDVRRHNGPITTPDQSREVRDAGRLPGYTPTEDNGPLILEKRLPRTNGHWTGAPGESTWISTKPEVNAVTGGAGIEFKNGRPDFSPWSKGTIEFEPGVLNGKQQDFRKIYDHVARERNLKGQDEAKEYLKDRGLTPHHLDDRTIQFVPTKLHKNIPHEGSASDMRR